MLIELITKFGVISIVMLFVHFWILKFIKNRLLRITSLCFLTFILFGILFLNNITMLINN